MKKQYNHLLPRKDRVAMAGLFSCLLAWEGIKYILPHHQQPVIVSALESEFMDTTFIDSGFVIEFESATIEDLTLIGFPEKISQRIRNYIEKGGHIANEKELMTIYGMDSTILQKVIRHIRFTDIKKHRRKKEIPESAKIDINSATIVEWEALPMIGLTMAERIVKFRNSLGGFISVDQVGTCYGVEAETMDIIRPYLVRKSGIRKIDLNTTNLDSLYHPYLSSRILKIAESYKRQHGPFTSQGDLKKVYPADTTWFVKALPYLSIP